MSGVNLANGATNAFHKLMQGGKEIKSNEELQSRITDGESPSKTEDVLKKSMERSDGINAQMMDLQTRHADKMTVQNTLSAMHSAEADAANKKISSTAQNAKGISY